MCSCAAVVCESRCSCFRGFMCHLLQCTQLLLVSSPLLVPTSGYIHQRDPLHCFICLVVCAPRRPVNPRSVRVVMCLVLCILLHPQAGSSSVSAMADQHTFMSACQAGWKEAAASTPNSILIFRGLRVRMGMAAGLATEEDVTYNKATARMQYAGELLIAAKVRGLDWILL